MKFHSVAVLTKLGTGVLTVLAAAILIAGCGGGSSYGGNGGGGGGGGNCGYGPCPTPTPTSAATDCSVSPASPVTIDLYFGIASCNDKTFGIVEGFSTDNAHSQVVKIASGSNVQFMATINGPHSADLLGTSLPFPGSDTNPETASAAGTDISAANFSTGTLNDGMTSAVYHASVAGMYLFGCHFHYGLGMKTVIIVQ